MPRRVTSSRVVSIPAGAVVAGILGMFRVVPILGVIAATWRLLLSALSGEEPVTTTDARAQLSEVVPEVAPAGPQTA